VPSGLWKVTVWAAVGCGLYATYVGMPVAGSRNAAVVPIAPDGSAVVAYTSGSTSPNRARLWANANVNATDSPVSRPSNPPGDPWVRIRSGLGGVMTYLFSAASAPCGSENAWNAQMLPGYSPPWPGI